MVDLYNFAGLIFVDVPTHAHYVLYNRANFMSLIFAVRRSSVKITKIGPLKNSPLYSKSLAEILSLYGIILHEYLTPSSKYWRGNVCPPTKSAKLKMSKPADVSACLHVHVQCIMLWLVATLNGGRGGDAPPPPNPI